MLCKLADTDGVGAVCISGVFSSLEASSEDAASEEGAAVVSAAVVAVEEELPQPVNKAAPIAAVKRNAIEFFHNTYLLKIKFGNNILESKKVPKHNTIVIETNMIRGATQID